MKYCYTERYYQTLRKWNHQMVLTEAHAHGKWSPCFIGKACRYMHLIERKILLSLEKHSEKTLNKRN